MVQYCALSTTSTRVCVTLLTSIIYSHRWYFPDQNLNVPLGYGYHSNTGMGCVVSLICIIIIISIALQLAKN